MLVGWSLAVQEVLTYAEQFGPGSLGGVVLVDGPIWDKLDPQDSSWISQAMRKFQRDRRKFIESFVRDMYRKPQGADYLRRVTEATFVTPTDSAVVLIRNMDRDDWTPTLIKLAEAKTPVLGCFTPRHKRSVDLLRAKLPSAEVVMFEDAGHALFVDGADRFNSELEQFLRAMR